jgi:hypothetical protein
MRETLEIFRANLERVRSIHALYVNFTGAVTSIVDLSDLLRAEIVLIVSALDHFVHELTRVGMMEIWRGTRATTPAYLRYRVSMDIATQLASATGVDYYLETEIRTQHSYLAFQQPERIADAVRLFSSIELWNEVGAALREDPKNITSQLKLIVDRRNKIAHEADVDPSYPGQRWPIGRKDAEEALSFIEKIGEAIFTILV